MHHLETRSAKRFRSKIREFLGFKVATLSDAKTLVAWLLERAKKEPYTLPLYREKANEFFLLNKLEPFTSEKTDRYIRSAIHQFEKQFFADIAKRLSPESLKLVHDLLHEDSKINDSQKERDQDDEITLRPLKADGVFQESCRIKIYFFTLTKLIHTDAPRPRFVNSLRPRRPGAPAQPVQFLP